VATNYPGGLDAPTNPTSGQNLNSPSHSGEHANANDAIVAIETALGITGAFNFNKISNNLSDVGTKGTGRFNIRVPVIAGVQCAATANVNIASAPASVDGFSFVSSGLDTVLLTAQSTPSQNGPWVWNGAGSALTRPTDWPAGGAVTTGRLVQVQNGTVNGGTLWMIAVPSAGITIDTTAQTWTALSITGTNANESIIRANTLDQMTAPAGPVSWNSQRITTLHQGVVSTDAPSLGQLAGNQMPYVLSGCVWTADSPGSTLLCSMTSGTVMIKGILLTVAAVTSRSFTANNDTYIDLADNSDGTASITYSAVANYVVSPALANSGTSLNTVRVAVISAGASAVASAGIGQGGLSFVSNGGTQPSTTVAAGSNTNNITATPLNVAASTSFPAAGCWSQVAHSSGQTYTIQNTGTGAGTLTGVTVIQGSGTVSTGDTVKGTWPVAMTDLLGNRIYPTNGNGGIIGGVYFSNAYTTTQTANTPIAGSNSTASFIAPFIIPPGTTRNIKATLMSPAFGSSAVAGTSLSAKIYAGNAATLIASVAPSVNVASDFFPLSIASPPQAGAPLSPGSYTAQVWTTQGAAGTLTMGASLLVTALYIELV
jgi:hypothetical protein